MKSPRGNARFVFVLEGGVASTDTASLYRAWPRHEWSTTTHVSFSPVPPLKPGAAVAVIAPAGPFDRPSFDRGLEVVAQRYRPVLGEHLFAQHRYLAGHAAQRAHDLQAAFSTVPVQAVFTARGGFGAAHLVPHFKPSPRALVGFSDVTALHVAMQHHRLRSLHGPVLTQLGRSGPEVTARLFDALEGRPLAPLTALRTVTPGTARGPLLGGNLSVLTRLLGTPWWPSLRGAVLLLEDVGERPYRLDRMWTHLSQAGALEGVAAIVFGELTGCEDSNASYTSGDVLDELAHRLGVPCAAGFPIGHGDVNHVVPLGAEVRLDATHRTLEFVEGLTS